MGSATVVRYLTTPHASDMACSQNSGWLLRRLCWKNDHPPVSIKRERDLVNQGHARKWSEREPRTKSPLARLVRTIQTGDEPETGVVDVAGRVGEVRVVRRIQGFRAKLKLHLFRDPERAEDAQIRLEEARTAKVISDSVAKDRAGLRRPGAT